MFKKKIWVFTRANTMTDHNFTDSVCITKARTKKAAIKNFSYLYNNVKPEEVREPYYYHGVAILTDY